MDRVIIEGSTATAVSPEGETAVMDVAGLARLMAAGAPDTRGAVLPDGIKAVLAAGPVVIWVHQTPPRIHHFKWIAAGSAARFGPEAEYRLVRISLPYLIVLAVFMPDAAGGYDLSPANECFFRVAPLESIDDGLFYPALLNCSKFARPEGHPLAWICTQFLNRPRLRRERDGNRRMRLGFDALMHCLLDAGFNESSEFHEQSSWFSESARVDPRLATVEAWEEATRRDPLFVLEVPWLPVDLSLRQVAARAASNLHQGRAGLATAGDVARLIFNGSAGKTPRSGARAAS